MGFGIFTEAEATDIVDRFCAAYKANTVIVTGVSEKESKTLTGWVDYRLSNPRSDQIELFWKRIIELRLSGRLEGRF